MCVSLKLLLGVFLNWSLFYFFNLFLFIIIYYLFYLFFFTGAGSLKWILSCWLDSLANQGSLGTICLCLLMHLAGIYISLRIKIQALILVKTTCVPTELSPQHSYVPFHERIVCVWCHFLTEYSTEIYFMHPWLLLWYAPSRFCVQWRTFYDLDLGHCRRPPKFLFCLFPWGSLTLAVT